MQNLNPEHLISSLSFYKEYQIIITDAVLPYCTLWKYQNGLYSCFHVWHKYSEISTFLFCPSYSTGKPKDCVGKRGHSWGPDIDCLVTQTCIARMPFPIAWWWRPKWACAMNSFGKKCEIKNKSLINLTEFNNNHCLFNSHQGFDKGNTGHDNI